jgi:hypothetical protein
MQDDKLPALFNTRCIYPFVLKIRTDLVCGMGIYDIDALFTVVQAIDEERYDYVMPLSA